MYKNAAFERRSALFTAQSNEYLIPYKDKEIYMYIYHAFYERSWIMRLPHIMFKSS